jgi:type IV pilus assembly protein PilM
MVYGKTNKKGMSVIDYGVCGTPGNSFSDDNIVDKRSVINALTDMLSQKNIKSKNVMIGIKGSDIIMRHIEMPVMPAKQLRQAVKLEVQQYLPMDLNEYIIDSKVIGKVDTKEKKVLNVLLVAAPKRKIEDYMYIADKLGLKVKAIDLFSNSAVRFFENHDTENKKTLCIVDIGYTSSTVNIIEKVKLFLEKEVEIGVKKIDDMLEKVFANTLENPETMREKTISLSLYDTNNSIDDPRYYYANNSARQIIDTLVDRIEKIFNFYYTSGINKRIDVIYIYGGGSKLSGIAEYIKNMINIETKLLDSNIMSNINNLDGDLKDRIEIYANCISLLLRKE